MDYSVLEKSSSNYLPVISNSASVWKAMKDITSYKTPSPSTVENCRIEKTPVIPPATPSPPPHLHCRSVNKTCVRSSERTKEGKHHAQMVRHQPASNPVLTSWHPSSHRSSTDHWALRKSPHAFNRSIISPVPKKPKMTGLNDYRPVTLTSVAMKSFERLVLAYLKDTTGSLLDLLQFAYRANRSVDDAVNMELQHLDRPGTYVRILLVDFSPAVNTIIPDTIQNKLNQLSIPTSVCHWITSFLTDRQAASEAEKIHIQHPYDQHWSSSEPCSLPAALLSLHERLHI